MIPSKLKMLLVVGIVAVLIAAIAPSTLANGPDGGHGKGCSSVQNGWIACYIHGHVQGADRYRHYWHYFWNGTYWASGGHGHHWLYQSDCHLATAFCADDPLPMGVDPPGPPIWPGPIPTDP